MRAAGLSANKLAAIIDLAAKFVDGTVPTHDLDGLTDDEIVARLVTIRGVGRWTAEMFLLFQLRRPDVWPVDDLGVRNGWARIHDMETAPLPKALLVLGDPLRPYRSTAAWYCWRAAAPIPGAVSKARRTGGSKPRVDDHLPARRRRDQLLEDLGNLIERDPSGRHPGDARIGGEHLE